MAGDVAIEWRGVNLRFGERMVLEDFSLTIGVGERVVIRGASGRGKTSLFRLLLGFERAAGGEVFFRGRRVNAASVWEVRREVAYVPQRVPLRSGTVRAAVESVLRFRANQVELRPEVFEELGLDGGILEQDVAGLSGGERQRVGLAIGLSLGRKVFLLDEPTAALDETSRARVVARFRSLPTDCTVVVIAHDEAWLDGARVISL